MPFEPAGGNQLFAAGPVDAGQKTIFCNRTTWSSSRCGSWKVTSQGQSSVYLMVQEKTLALK